MLAGAYSDLASPKITSVFTSSPATKAVTTGTRLSSDGVEPQQSGYFYYTESGGTITITGYKTDIGLYPGGDVISRIP